MMNLEIKLHLIGILRNIYIEIIVILLIASQLKSNKQIKLYLGPH